MTRFNANPTRDQARIEILAALASGEYMNIDQIFDSCPTLDDRGEMARLAYDMTRNGAIVKGEKMLNRFNKWVNTYCISSDSDEKKLGENNHPWKQAAVTPKEAKEPRVTRDLPVHLQTPIPPVFAAQEGVECPPDETLVFLDDELIEAIAQLKEEDEIMTEETAEYMTNEEELSDALARDEDIEADAALEASRLAIVDAMLAYAHDELRGNRVWMGLERAYMAVAGSAPEASHG